MNDYQEVDVLWKKCSMMKKMLTAEMISSRGGEISILYQLSVSFSK
jgi:hypothetical protein